MPNPISNALRPMLAVPAAEPFDSMAHVFDVAWGGLRALAFIDRARLRLMSQSGRAITAWFPELASIAGQVRSDGTVLDGEIVALGYDGRPDLALLAPRLSCGLMEGDLSLAYQAFDILSKSGHSVMDQPLERRRQVLQSTLSRPGPALAASWVESDGVACFEAIAAQRLPGMVAKERNSTYVPGQRSPIWQEIRVYESETFVVGGYLIGHGREGPVAGLLLGEADERRRLSYAGMVSAGFPDGGFEAALAAVNSPVCPFTTAPAVRHGGRTSEGLIRFPVFVSLRPDLDWIDCVPYAPPADRSNQL
jgi:bifunctional non-homologous end joining protein LigD